MTATILTSSQTNSFAVFREILQGISAFTSVFAKAKFTENTRYFEDEPNPKSRSFPGYPVVVIDTDSDDERLAYKNAKQTNFVTRIMIYSDYFAEQNNGFLKSYMDAIIDYFNTNQGSLLRTYGIDEITISKSRDRDEIAEAQLVVGTLTFNYVKRFDVE